MSANVALSETFDQWRVKTNELLVMTQTDGSSNFIKLNNLTNSTSNTTGSIITTGGVGIGKSVVIGEHLNVHGNIHANGNITADGNITIGNADTDTVVFQAEVDSNFIPDDDVTYNIGSSSKRWANVFAQTTRLIQDSDSGELALYIDANDVDQQVVVIDAEQTTVNVFQIDADALTTGAAMVIEDNSASTGTRKTVHIDQQGAAATGATGLQVTSNGGAKGVFIDKNYTAVGATTAYGLDVDLDQTAASGTATINTTGINIDASGAGGGTNVGTAIGLKSAVGGTAATKFAGIFTGGNTGFGVTDPDSMVEVLSTSRQLKLSYSGTVATGFTVDSGGTLTITGTTAGTFSGALSGTTVAMTGNITTTADIAANTASVLTGSCITADGAIGMGVEQATPSQPASGKGLMYMKDGGGLYWRSNEKTEIELSQAGASTSEENIFTASQTFDDQALTSGATVAWNANTAQVATLTLAHNATISNATNHKSGGVYILRVTQATSPKTVAWGTNYKWPSNTAPVMTATGGAVDVFTFVSDGTYMYGSFSGSQNFT